MKQGQLFQKPMLLACLLLVSLFCSSQPTEQWVRRYSGPGSLSYDRVTDMAVDALGNVYVTGAIDSDSGPAISSDYATIKYDAVGNEVWVKRYNSPENGSDVPGSLAVDGAGNVYVTGNTATIKYDAAGSELWVKGGGSSLAVDASGNLYVTGDTIRKYDAAGNVLWMKDYPGFGTSLAVDALGNVYIIGYSTGSNGSTTYTTIKYDAAGTELWIKQYGTGGGATALAIDTSGNVYITGSSFQDETGEFVDYATVKYDAAGAELWVARYNAGLNDFPTSLAVDGAGNVYVTGWSDGAIDSDGHPTSDYATVKYDAAGNELWARHYDGTEDYIFPSNDAATSLAVDGSGNVYVTGELYTDYGTVKYDAAGAVLWVARYNPGYATSLAVDASGNVYVTGNSRNDYVTIKYTQTAGIVLSYFTLVNADFDQNIRELRDGDTINLAALSASGHINIRANTSPAAKSVVFDVSGAETRNHTENIVPYALFADNNNGDYYSWMPKNGDYTLTGTPYSATKGRGAKGTPLTIRFHVFYQTVDSFTLVNAETGQDIKTLNNNDVIDLATLPTTKLNIRANTTPDTIGSVYFTLSGPQRRKHTENLVPYALFADNTKGDYYDWTPTVGNYYYLYAYPYDHKNHTGNLGFSYGVSFHVVNTSSTTQTRAANVQQKPVAVTSRVDKALMAVPNPFAGHTTIHFSVPHPGYTTLHLYDMKGKIVERLYEAQAEGRKGYSVLFDSKGLSSGVYVVRLTTDKHIQSYILVLIR